MAQALRSDCRRPVGRHLAAQKYPKQSDTDDAEWDEGFVQAFAEVAEGPKGVKKMQGCRGGNESEEVVDSERQWANPTRPGANAVGARHMSNEREAEEALERVAGHPRQFDVATATSQQNAHDTHSGTDEVP